MTLTAVEAIDVIQNVWGHSLYDMSRVLSCDTHKVQIIQLSDYRSGNRQPEFITAIKILLMYGIAISNIHKRGKGNY